MTRAMATVTKRAMATNGDTTGSGYHCPPSSAAAAAVVGKDDKGGGGLFLYGVVVKKLVCAFSQFDVWQGGRLSGLPFLFPLYGIPRVGFLFEQS
jgi:hypothetical protein